ncbi:MAG TPA: hypothetical protein PK098_04060 [Phycisphaerales bacterium]|nr:hypothetical protein [Phycisphaerales bacterium]
MASRKERRERIREIVDRNEIQSQEQLQELLAVEGIEATQATISRDLRDLGATKSRTGYAIVDMDSLSRGDVRELRRMLKADVLSIERATGIVVVKTRFGHAKPLAVKLDQAGLPQIVGTVSGDDTVFIATRSSSQAGELRRMLQRLAK